MTINDRIAELEAELAALKVEAAKPKTLTGQPGWPMLEAPEEGYVHVIVETAGNTSHRIWFNSPLDKDFLTQGRCHKTKEGAERASLQERTTHKLRKVIAEVTAEVAPGWVPDWGGDSQAKKGYLFFDIVTGGWRIARGAVAFRVPGVLYFPPEAGEEIIRRMGAELDNLL